MPPRIQRNGDTIRNAATRVNPLSKGWKCGKTGGLGSDNANNRERRQAFSSAGGPRSGPQRRTHRYVDSRPRTQTQTKATPMYECMEGCTASPSKCSENRKLAM